MSLRNVSLSHLKKQLRAELAYLASGSRDTTTAADDLDEAGSIVMGCTRCVSAASTLVGSSFARGGWRCVFPRLDDLLRGIGGRGILIGPRAAAMATGLLALGDSIR